MEPQIRDEKVTIYSIFGRTLSASTLKTLAIVFMIIDHIGAVIIAPRVTSAPDSYPYYELLRSIGRMSFPLYAFLLIQGFRHSHNRIKYFAWLFVFGLITEPFFDYANKGLWVYVYYQNVLFTLSLSLLMLIILEKIGDSDMTTVVKNLATVLVVLVVVTIGYFDHSDYGVTGPLIILGIKAIEERYNGSLMQMFSAMVGTIYLSYFIKGCLSDPGSLLSIAGISNQFRQAAGIQLYGSLAIFFIAAYDGSRGRQLPKLFYYLIYPVHLLILALIK